MRDLSGLFAQIAASHPDKAWTSLEKAQALAAIVVALRPSVGVEIGVWQGDSLMGPLLAMKHVGVGKMIAIDSWAASASVIGETEANAKWWGETVGQAGHDDALRIFIGKLDKNELSGICEIWRRRSDEVTPPACQFLHIDGGHTEQAVRDATRFAPMVDVGGILVFDDLHWDGAYVERAHELAQAMGFVDLYELGTGVVMQRRTA